jgi:glucosamine-phosphate N-acetyltransferase
MEKLSINDYEEYLALMSHFRETKNMNLEEFKKVYEKVCLTSNIYILKENNKIIGSITIIIEQKIINNNGRVAHIEDLVIHPEHRKAGIGSKLLKFAKTIAKNENCYKIILNADESIENFYTNNGFSKYGISFKYNLIN